MAKKASAPSCKCKKTECEECPEWIFTFADLVMLMMGFFVILWVLKPNPTAPSTVGPDAKGAASAAAADQHWIDQVAAIRDSFGAVGNPSSNDPVERALAKRQNLTPAGPQDKGRSVVRPTTPTGTDADPTAIRPAKTIDTGGKLLFGRGSAALTAELTTQVDQVAGQVKGHRNIVLVQGHTSLDDLDDAATPAQKLDLSLRRAQAVADRLTADGVSPDVLRVVGCSTFEPVVAGQYSPNSQADNRRVEVQMSQRLVSDLQATRPTSMNP
jgi:outer membrane protein OmpA-like peptidoglycan-associated protein